MGLFKTAKNANRMIRDFEQVSGLETRSAKNLVAQIKQGTPFSDSEILVIGAEAIRNADAKANNDPKAAYFDTIQAWKQGRLTFSSGTPLNQVPNMTEKHVGYITANVLAAVRPQAAQRISAALQDAGV